MYELGTIVIHILQMRKTRHKGTEMHWVLSSGVIVRGTSYSASNDQTLLHLSTDYTFLNIALALFSIYLCFNILLRVNTPSAFFKFQSLAQRFPMVLLWLPLLYLPREILAMFCQSLLFHTTGPSKIISPLTGTLLSLLWLANSFQVSLPPK